MIGVRTRLARKETRRADIGVAGVVHLEMELRTRRGESVAGVVKRQYGVFNRDRRGPFFEGCLGRLGRHDFRWCRRRDGEGCRLRRGAGDGKEAKKAKEGGEGARREGNRREKLR